MVNVAIPIARGRSTRFAAVCFGVAIAVFTAWPAAAQELDWAKAIGNGSVYGMGLDATGAVYLAGTFQGTADFGSIQLVHAGASTSAASDIFIAKYSSTGAVQWAKRAGGSGYDNGVAMAVNDTGVSCVVGSFEAPATFGSGTSGETTLSPSGSYAAQYASDGTLLWARRTAGQQTGVAIDASGNCYVAGWFGDQWELFGSETFLAGEATQTTLTSPGYASVFVAKYTAGGALAWVKAAGGATSSAFGFGIAVDNSGNSHVTGQFIGAVTFGAGESNAVTMSTGNEYKLFVAKFASSGALQWARRAVGATSFSQGTAIAVDQLGNSYVAGLLRGSTTVGENEANETTLNESANSPFLARYDAGGWLLWAQTLATPRYRADNGRAEDEGWTDPVITAVAVDSAGTATLTGSLTGVRMFDAERPRRVTVIGPPGVPQVVVAQFGSDGAFRWVVKGQGAESGGLAAAAGASGTVYVAGLGAPTLGSEQARQVTLAATGSYRAGFVSRWAASTGQTDGDVDGDGRYDAVFYSAGQWVFQNSSQGFFSTTGIYSSTRFGTASHVAAAADYDGDGRLDVAVYLDGAWSIRRSSDGVITNVGWGGPEFDPVPGDYDGDGRADVAVYHRGGVWSILRSSDGGSTVVGWGGSGWRPVPGDYDGDGRTDIAVYSDGRWSIVRSSDASNTVVGWGGSDWTPVPGDYDGDGRTDIAVYRMGDWSIVRSSDGVAIRAGAGGSDWLPAPGDYDGDGKTDVAAWRSTSWHIVRSSDGRSYQGFFPFNCCYY